MNVQKRGLVPYDDKRIHLTDLLDGQPNPDTHAFGYYSLDVMHVLDLEQPAANKEMVVVFHASWNARYETRLARKHATVVNKECADRLDNGDNLNNELYVDKL